ncbi:MAG: hypothetical protein M1832_000424 [Thelocarpon impressellum]|nr:MAG: hypothetical protein M1832_000424 [Thelocarpon impressellum]
MDDSSTSPPLKLTIRFTVSHPDLSLAVPSPSTTTAVSLKCRIRAQLPPDVSTRHIRLIHAGRVLADTAPLSSLLPPANPKGKAPLRSVSTPAHIYIHASIGDQLAPSALAAEEADAVAADAAAVATPSRAATPPLAPSSTVPGPTGFDRLLSAGLSAPEIASLRAQFLSLQAHVYTPDTMPSGAELRALEGRWLDEGGDSASDPATGAPGTGMSASVAGYEDMLLGNVLGFFWPLGALVWLLREEGVWSGRRQMAVFTGIMVNVAFSVLRVTS